MSDARVVVISCQECVKKTYFSDVVTRNSDICTEVVCHDRQKRGMTPWLKMQKRRLTEVRPLWPLVGGFVPWEIVRCSVEGFRLWPWYPVPSSHSLLQDFRFGKC